MDLPLDEAELPNEMELMDNKTVTNQPYSLEVVLAIKMKEKKLNLESHSSKANKVINKFDFKVKNNTNKIEVKRLEASPTKLNKLKV